MNRCIQTVKKYRKPLLWGLVCLIVIVCAILRWQNHAKQEALYRVTSKLTGDGILSAEITTLAAGTEEAWGDLDKAERDRLAELLSSVDREQITETSPDMGVNGYGLVVKLQGKQLNLHFDRQGIMPVEVWFAEEGEFATVWQIDNEELADFLREMVEAHRWVETNVG